MTKREAKKDKRRKKLFIAFIMILFTGIVLTASTYAWFTANRTVTVESIDVNVSTSQGLQISTDATNWKSIVTNDDITSVAWSGVKNQLPQGEGKTTVPVSTAGNVTGGFLDMYKGTIESNETTGVNYLISEKDEEKNGQEGNFVAFDLFFQSTEAQKVYLTSSSKVIAKAETTSTGIENAARVAFIKEGSVVYGSTPGAAQALRGNEAMMIWEPNENTHTASAIDNARNVYGLEIGANHAKLAYKGVLSAFDKAAQVQLNSTDADKFGEVTTVGTPTAGISDEQFLEAFTIAEGVTKIRIYMWIEGQDVDCEDRASGGSISYNLQFSINEKA